MSKNFLIITAFFNYDYPIRIQYLERFLVEKGYNVTILSSDFNHRTKEYFSPQYKNLKLIHVPEYKKNLSFRRLFSHYIFSRRCKEYCLKHKPDMIYAITPPNSLFMYLSSVKKKSPGNRLFFEIEDLWPESLPVPGAIKKILFPVFEFWKFFRNHYINCADSIVFECNLFKNYLSKRMKMKPSLKTIYLTKENYNGFYIKNLENDVMRILYLGSINNLIDIDFIVTILSELRESCVVELHIIGGGEQTGKLIDRCSISNINVCNHGVIYNEMEKASIICNCHFAINIMKETVFVGATMKSLEYFHYGIPVLNNIPGDSETIVKEYGCGFNVDKNNYRDISRNLYAFVRTDRFLDMRKKSRRVYEELFCPDAYYNKVDFLIKQEDRI